jgi:hypothetical protein
MPVLHALQGHPESPRLFEDFTNVIVDSLGDRCCGFVHLHLRLLLPTQDSAAEPISFEMC